MSAEVVDSRQALTFDGNAQARDESSWWSQTSWFSNPSAAPTVPIPDTGLIQRSSDANETSGSQQPGGAASQCRFASRSCHIPYGTTSPVDGSPLAASAMRQSPALTPAVGQTCDGLPPQHRAAGNSRLGTAEYGGTWRFNLESWRWERKGGVLSCSASATAVDEAADKHALAARRWGDGRDGLASAIKRARLVDSAEAEGTAALTFTKEVPEAESQPAEASNWSAKSTKAGGFASVGGLHKQKEALRRAIVVPLRHPALLRALGARPGRGALLHGPPGSGKTLLAAAIAAEAGVHLETVNGAEAVAGQGAEKKLQRAFDRAQSMAPSLLLIDEIDAIIPARNGSSSETERQAGARLMWLLDRLTASGAPVAVVATSSRPAALDGAVRRPGRLDLEVSFGALPTAERLEVLRLVTASMPMAPQLDLATVAESMRGFVGADCQAAVTEAALECVSEALAAAEAGSPGIELGEVELQLLAERMRVTPRHFSAALSRVRPSSLRGLVPELPSASWQDVGGLALVKRQLRDLIELPLRRPDLLAKFGMSAPRGALLYGPPGCGKTLLARAAAAQCGANFLSVRGPELLDRWLGQSEANVRDIFASARGAAPCVIFFDEMDAIAPRRSGPAGCGSASGDSAAARVLNQLLAEMDGLSSGAGSSHVFVLGATNRPEALDPALLRPGRMDALIKVPLPDAAGRLAVLRASLRHSPLSADVDLSAIATATSGFSGADLAEICRRAGRSAIRASIRSEQGVSSGAPLEEYITGGQLSAALEGARCSVSPEQTAHFDEIERAMLMGGIVETAVQKAAQAAAEKEQARAKHELVIAAVARATESIAAQQIASLELAACEREKHVAALVQALRAAGLPVPAP